MSTRSKPVSSIVNKSTGKALKKVAVKPKSKKRSAKGKADFGKQSVWLSGPALGLIGVECAGLAASGLLATVLVLGASARFFSGTGFFANLLPFALGIAIWVAVAAGLLLLWFKSRRWLVAKSELLPALTALCVCFGTVNAVWQQGFPMAIEQLRSLVGGKQQAARTTLAHQIYAAYRRSDSAQLNKLIGRAQSFDADIRYAAASYELDPDLLYGVAAAESSFLPRTSADGGQGLFQITAVPKFILQQVSSQIAGGAVNLADSKHNALVAAATLKHYLAQMKGDLFLGLLAYNIGPQNGGLKHIMQRYGAVDFVTMQPYFQQLPRDYPIRVLCYALAFRLWHETGQLPAYEAGDNAGRIQRAGIPGLVSWF
ncbi:transglycosylase SLT domain-containing protein [Methylomonas sp. HYX-M1]|uniref:transglycosylase SLT domain-containing protein n=1 Tax=Methylomonas sp. HYX-M1 TaxID=3139307 RepID=UPI00345BB1D0